MRMKRTMMLFLKIMPMKMTTRVMVQKKRRMTTMMHKCPPAFCHP